MCTQSYFIVIDIVLFISKVTKINVQKEKSSYNKKVSTRYNLKKTPKPQRSDVG